MPLKFINKTHSKLKLSSVDGMTFVIDSLHKSTVVKSLFSLGSTVPIYIKCDESNRQIAHLAKENWDLPTQIMKLEDWLLQSHSNLSQSNYIADVGFSIRENACGGGAILSPEAMRIMGELGITLYLSEYGE